MECALKTNDFTYWAILSRTLLANRAGLFFSSSVGICGGRNWKTEQTHKKGHKKGQAESKLLNLGVETKSPPAENTSPPSVDIVPSSTA